jgi:hypothetical protein
MDEISRIVDRLIVAKAIAMYERRDMLAYLIDLAIQEAREVQEQRLRQRATERPPPDGH